MACVMVGSVALAHRLDGGARWDGKGVCLLAICAVMAAVFGVISLLGLGVHCLRGRATFDGKTLALADQGARYEFPREAIRSLAVVVRKRRVVDIDLTLPPHRMFSRADAVALEVEVSEGRIRFFKLWGKRDLRWVAETLGHTMNVNITDEESGDRSVGCVADATAEYRCPDSRNFIVQRYRVPTLAAGADHGMELVRWTTPQALFDSWSRRDSLQLRWMAVRIAGLSSLALWGFCVVLARVDPSLPARRVVLVVGAQVFILCGSFVWISLRKRKPNEYQLTTAGIVRTGLEHPLVRWERLSGYRVKADEQFDSYAVVTLFRKRGSPCRVPLPGDDRDRLIMVEVRKRLRYQP